MASKREMVSVSAWERIRKECGAPAAHNVDWHGETLVIRPLISLAEVVQFVDNVIGDCFGESVEEYHPEVKAFSIARYFIHFYTNLRLPTDIAKQYDLIFGTDILSVVEDHVDYIQKMSINTAIEEKIDMLLDMNVAALNKQLGKISSAIDEVGNAFGGIDPGDIEKLMQSISEGALDQEKLIGAYLRQMKEQGINNAINAQDAGEPVKKVDTENTSEVHTIDLA